MTNLKNEKMEINLTEAVWKMLEQWRAVIIVAVIIGLLCASYKYVQEMHVYQNDQARIAQMQENEAEYTDMDAEAIEQQLSALSESERLSVENLLHMRERLAEAREYNTNSLLMQMDPYNEHVLKMEYGIVLDNNEQAYLSTALTAAYQENLKAQVSRVIMDNLQIQTEQKYVDELIQFPYYDEDMPAAIEMEIVLPEGIDASLVQSEAERILNELHISLSQNICSHQIRQYYVGESIVTDYENYDDRVSHETRIANLANYIKSEEAALSSAQTTAYEQIISIQEKGAANVEAEALDAPSVSVKWFGVGFILGIIIYFVLYIIYMIFAQRIRTLEEIERVWGVYGISSVCRYSKYGLGRLINSKHVFNLKHKGKLDVDAQIKLITDFVKAVGQKLDLSEVSFVPVMNENMLEKIHNWEMIRQMITEQTGSEKMTAALCQAYGPEDQIRVLELSDCKSIIPIVFSGKSKPEMMTALLENAQLYQIPVLGAVVVAG